MTKRQKTGGRKKGTPNRVTATVRETFEKVFNALQDGRDADLEVWARDNPTEFYKLAARLIPVDMTMQAGITMQVISGVPQPGEHKTIEHQPSDVIDVEAVAVEDKAGDLV